MTQFVFTTVINGGDSLTSFFEQTLDGGSSSGSFIEAVNGQRANNDRIRNKISTLVASQFPEYIQTEFPKFLTFVELYYEYLEKNKQAYELLKNSSSYLDIDSTTNDFVRYIIQNYAKDIPLTSVSDKPFLVKKIQDLYEAKGSELSFKILFNLIYQKDVSIVYPYENVLIPSDGVWVKNYSLHVQLVSGSVADLLNRLLSYTTVDGARFDTTITDIKKLDTNLYEIFLDRNNLASSYNFNRSVYVYQDDEILFEGIIKPSPTSYSIITRGFGFKVGQFFEVTAEGGRGTLVKITKVNSAGGIVELRFIRFGINYPETIPQLDFLTNFVQTSTTNAFNSSTNGSTDQGSIFITGPTQSSTYFAEDYLLENTYIGEVIQTFSSNSYNVGADVPGTKSPAIATIQFTNGALLEYPGYYNDIKGFLSENDIVLEDDLVHQPFAYQTQTSVDYRVFFDTVKRLIHPAGLRLFNNLLIENQFSVSDDVKTSNIYRGNINFEAYDNSVPVDFNFYELSTEFSDEASATEFRFNNVQKPISNFVSNSDNNKYDFYVTFSDVVDLFDQTSIDQNVLSDSLSFIDSFTILDKELQKESVTATNSTDRRNITKFVEDQQNLQDATSISTSTPVSDDQNVDDISLFSINNSVEDITDQITDSGVITLVEVYAEDYFLEDYVSGTQFIF